MKKTAVQSDKSAGAEGITAQQLSDAFAQMLQDDSARNEDAVPPASSAGGAADNADVGDAFESAEEDAVCPVTPKSVLEALLFVGSPANESLTRQQAVSIIHGTSVEEIDELVEELNAEYEAASHPYHIVCQGAGYRLVLRDEFERIRDRFYGRIRAAKLSQAAVEVLALVAYNQPLTVDDVTKLRGHPSGAILSQLVRRQLLRIERPAEKPRRPIYFTTHRFLKLFGMESLEELPRSQEIGP
jgi:segregation and condensation protein B